ncbi:hypothetical protein I7I52_12363 [Histoplasma capsulatum]|uniref:Uncharacterized protein n=1 Tax=Ajellomyces capsulatus TaxID=5037 RepID=A0A8H7YCL2_AJECA|nr:hypothetical protein I7I52_12363 [Histoplasma capsulatum]
MPKEDMCMGFASCVVELSTSFFFSFLFFFFLFSFFFPILSSHKEGYSLAKCHGSQKGRKREGKGKGNKVKENLSIKNTTLSWGKPLSLSSVHYIGSSQLLVVVVVVRCVRGQRLDGQPPLGK